MPRLTARALLRGLRSRLATDAPPIAAEQPVPFASHRYLSLASYFEQLDRPALSRGLELTRYELGVFSQNGEDGVIAEILKRIEAKDEWFVEFGVETGIEGNTVLLSEVLGWRGLYIQPQPDFEALARRWQDHPRVQTHEALVTSANVDEILDLHRVPDSPDIISIDVDGNDLHIWRALKRMPRLVVIEYNAALSRQSDDRYVQPDSETPWDGWTNFWGASLGALEMVGVEKGYQLVHTDMAGVNAFFVRQDLVRPGMFPTADHVPRRAPNYDLSGRGNSPPWRESDYLRL